MADHMHLGQLGENQAVSYLKKLGYHIVDQNVRSGRWGEIDIVALHQGDLVFVEVKTRRSIRFGHPIEAVTPSKIQALRRAAYYYKLTNPNSPDSLRIDVVVVIHQGSKFNISLYQNIDII